MEGKISVVIPVYNVENYLPKCIESIQNQTHRNLEILLINDGSTDRSGEICDRYAASDDRIKVIHKENGGLSDARNAGIDSATGDFVGFVDSDDWVDLDMYELLYGLIIEHEADVAICRIKAATENGVMDESTDDLMVCSGEEALRIMVTQENNFKFEHGVTNKLIERQLLQNFRFPVGKLMEDLYFTPPLLHASNRIVYINRAKYNYLVDRQDSIMNSNVSEKMIFDDLNGHLQLERFLSGIGLNDCLSHINEVLLSRVLYFHHEVKKSSLKNKEALLTELEELFHAKYTKGPVKSKRQLQINLFALSPALFNQIQGSVRRIKAYRGLWSKQTLKWKGEDSN